MSVWLTITAAGLLTFATRLSLIFLYRRFRMPHWFRRALRFVPAAVLTAIFLPELVLSKGAMALTWRNPQLLAGLIAILVAWRTKNVVLTIAVGMASFLLLRSL